MKNPSPLITSLMGRHLRMMRIREIRERLRLRLADGISRIPAPPVPRPGIGICALARTLAARHCAANPEDTARFMRRLARIGGSTAHLAVPDTLISAAITLQPSTTDPGDRSVHHRDFPAFPDGILVGDTLLNAPGLTFVDDGSARFGPEIVPGTVWTRIIGGGIIGMPLSTLFAFNGTPEHPFDPVIEDAHGRPAEAPSFAHVSYAFDPVPLDAFRDEMLARYAR